MRTRLHKLGNSRAIVIPKPLLAQLGIEAAIELELVDDHIEVRKPEVHPRSGWRELLSALPESAFDLSEEDRDWLDAPEVGD